MSELEALRDLRRDVVMALCTEDQDEERTDEEIVGRVRELVRATNTVEALSWHVGEHLTVDSISEAMDGLLRERNEARTELHRQEGDLLGKLTVMESRAMKAEAEVERLRQQITDETAGT